MKNKNTKKVLFSIFYSDGQPLASGSNSNNREECIKDGVEYLMSDSTEDFDIKMIPISDLEGIIESHGYHIEEHVTEIEFN